jgi:hypothetical protein
VGAAACRELRSSHADANGQLVEVHVLAAQPCLLLRPEWTVRPEEEHQSPARPQRIGEDIDLGDGGDLSFHRTSLSSTSDAAAVAADEFIVDRGLHDGFEKPVGLGNGRLPPVSAKRSVRAGRGDLVQVRILSTCVRGRRRTGWEPG